MSLLRTAARASVATRVIGNTHRRQQQRWAAQDAATPAPARVPTASPAVIAEAPAAPTPSPSAPTSEVIAQLTQLAQLRDNGVLTEEEFLVQKQRVLLGS
ncbi:MULTISPECIES: SHOCT domain-containing protein [Microbacterium]|jgi:hypothetical protein|uniref:SHOCT domain-containing protein n=2 Tax=Microbacterium maritypicum TaxID=33918 RepID=A0ACD4B4B1_MICMQ|nr:MULTISPECIES: SHOCT domain-containing protein [Microbacterium]AZS48519.1 hypothetical protein CVS53_03240 [Microbacterium oxydans]EYT60199.1 hypothetical protein D514_0104085 [Microbacterium sp. UCD-TDU]MBP5801129.1 SHOCT domain-containing protein [Microbacterium liquefaciens]UTT52485.1 SHOCT domain-containing protein [Microbacterium liquefaciens]WEF20512.1 SHOCT domain-containing protein [Microbacterium liquefaciens]